MTTAASDPQHHAPQQPGRQLPDPQDLAPFGAQSPRPAWPLYLSILVYAAWFGILVWLALAYPALR